MSWREEILAMLDGRDEGKGYPQLGKQHKVEFRGRDGGHVLGGQDICGEERAEDL